ncbi:hypothetical protein HJC99_01190 [Candidatus Saccharibacteria bacterium]|nr:hypothetical protein [Candidatus Saccharibacteria bacterium]
MTITRIIKGTYRELIYHQRREVTFWILVTFLPTFGIARFVVHTDPTLYFNYHGTHVHHFTYGIVLLTIAGYAGLVVPQRTKPYVAALYGIGLALAFDEFVIWLHLNATYNSDGSTDAVVLITIFLVGVVYFQDVARAIIRRLWRGTKLEK